MKVTTICGCYARKSTDEGDRAADAKSVTRQVQRAKEFAKARGWRFDDALVFSDDGISGAEFRARPGLNSLLSAVKEKRHRLGALVVSEQSRLGRDTIRTLALIQSLNDSGVRIYSYLEDRELSIDDEMGEVQEFMRSWAGASERRKASQRVRDKMRQLAEQGRSTGGRLYGYHTEGGQRTIKPSEAAVVRRIFKRRAQGAGYFKIARELERDGVPAPRGGKIWPNTQVGSILRNPTYAGAVVWGRTRQVRRRGTAVTEKSPDAVVRREEPSLRIVVQKLFDDVQRINEQSAEATWPGAGGRLKSRPTASPHLLTPFLACGLCGKPMHHRRDKKQREWLICSTVHRSGKQRCPNTKQLSVELAEKAVMTAFEEALAGKIVMTELEAVLERQRAAQRDPAPLQAEANKIRAELKRLVDSLARGELDEVHEAIGARRARLSEVEAELSGAAAIQSIDPDAFRERVGEVLADWRAHLRKNVSTAQQVLRKILPTRLMLTPSKKPGVLWEFEGTTDYRKVLDEFGLDAVRAAILQVPQLVRTPCRRGR